MKRLKKLREQRHISQLKLAMDLGLNQNAVSRYENGVQKTKYANIINFDDYYGVSIDYLLERTDNPAMNQ